MAESKRDNAPTSSTSDQQPRASRSNYRPSQAPLFSSRGSREPISFSNGGRARQARLARQKEDGEFGSPTGDLPRTTTGGSGNWLNQKNGSNETRFGLEKAWQMAEQSEKSRTRNVNESPGGIGRRESPLPESRIPRSRTYSPAQSVVSSPPSLSMDAYKRADTKEWDDVPVWGSSDSDVTGPRGGSPSPAARNRGRTNLQSTKNRSQSDTLPELDATGLAEIREKARREARLRRAAARTDTSFARVNNTNIGERVAGATKPAERQGQTGQSESKESEPPLENVPRAWGSKARKRADWISKILSPESSMEIQDLPPDIAEEFVKSAADSPLPSVEAGTEPTPPSSRPASAQPVNASPEKSKMWDADLDFTAQSLQISTSPQLRIKLNKLDQIRDREIQNLTARAVATNRLEEIRERNSEERSLNSDSGRRSLKGSAPESFQQQAANEPYYERTILDEEGERISDTPITIFSAGSYRGRDGSSDEVVKEERNPRATQSSHKREESFDLLRRLSRAASSSPAPLRPSADIDIKPKPTVDDLTAGGSNDPSKNTVGQTDGKSLNAGLESSDRKTTQEKPRTSDLGLNVQIDTKRSSRSSSRPRSDADPEERIAAEAKLFDLPDNKSERNSIREPSPSPPTSEVGEIDETPRPKKQDPFSLPTPRVTGAFIETPAPTIRKAGQTRSVSPHEKVEYGDTTFTVPDTNNGLPADILHQPQTTDRRRSSSSSSRSGRSEQQAQSSKPRSRPPLINTAATTSASEDLRRLRMEAQIDDSTLDDFDGLLEAKTEAEVDVVVGPSDPEPIVDLEYDEKGIPLSKAEQERRLESLVLDRMHKHLKNTSSSIRDARQGIDRLVNQVSSADFGTTPTKLAGDGQLYLKLPVPHFWVETLEAKLSGGKQTFFRRNWKFTWLGFILSAFVSWYLAESTMCELYCHPTHSSRDNWDPSDPFFPWAIPTKLDQWTGGIISTGATGSWEFIDGLLGPKKGRRRRPQSMGASDWWLGRDGPVDIVKPLEEGSILSDEVL